MIIPADMPFISTEDLIKLEEKFNEFENNLPPGYSIIVGGEAESRGQSQSQIYSSAIIYLLLITFGLVFALNSFKQTLLILSVAIFSIGLSFLGLKLGQQNYGFIGTVGALGLIGLSINDSIIVLSHIKEKANQVSMTKSDLIEVKNPYPSFYLLHPAQEYSLFSSRSLL